MEQITNSTSISAIVHCDQDALFCGLIIRRKYPWARVYPTNYGKEVREDWFGDVTFVADYSFSLEFMQNMETKTKLIWIDHHQIVDDLQAQGFNPPGLRRRDCSAAQLVWEYLYPGEPIPTAVRYVSDYDTWQWSKDINSLYFHYGLETLDLKNNDKKSDRLFEKLITDPDYVDRICLVGRKIDKYNHDHNEIVCTDGCFETEFEGIKALACNIKNVNSLLFASKEDKYKDFPLRILFSYFSNIGKYRVTVFSNDSNVRACDLCARYDGGGHPGAAGFATGKLPFALPQLTDTQPSFDNIFRPLQEAIIEDPVVRRAANTGTMPLVWSHQFAGVIGDYSAVIINHPSATVDAYYATGLSNLYSLGAFVSLTNTGWYRWRIYILDPRLDIKQVCETLNKTVLPEGRTEYKIVGNAIWCYTKTFTTP